MVWRGEGWVREVTAVQESAGIGCVEVVAVTVTPWGEGGGSMRANVEALGSELKQPACLA